MLKASRLVHSDLSTCRHMLQGEMPKRAVTGIEFFHRFPLLHSYLLGQLCSAAQGVQEGTSQMHPSLYPILVLLSRLRHATQATGSTEVLLSTITTKSGICRYLVYSRVTATIVCLGGRLPASQPLTPDGCGYRRCFLASSAPCDSCSDSINTAYCLDTRSEILTCLARRRTSCRPASLCRL